MSKGMKKYAKESSGFSFVELMVVIALIGILSAIVLPGFLRSLPEKRLKNAARNLYADMQRARLLAVKENRTVRIRFDTTDNFYYLDDDNSGDYNGTGDNREERSRRNLSEDNVSYGSGKATENWNKDPINNVVPTYIRFRSTGTAFNRSTYLQNQNQDVCYAVTVTNYGAVKIRRFNGTDWDED